MKAPRARRGFATLMVFGVLSLAAVVIGTMQSSSYGQAVAGREALARTRASWAARAGVEAALASIEHATQNPDLSSAYALIDDLTGVAYADLGGADYRVATFDGTKEVPGPADAHAKLNINRMTRDQLLAIEPLMSEDIADAIIDWIDSDDDSQPLGAEVGYYLGLPYPYEPRNGPFRSIAELELVAGVDARDVRGEDWNLNGLLDPNEDDGDATWPPDNADGILDAGWSGVLTALSMDGTLAPSGEPRLNLQEAQAGELVERVKVDSAQADAIINYVATNPSATMRDFIIRNLSQLAQQGQQGQRSTPVQDLTREQLGLLLDEATVGPPEQGAFIPGKLNINTCPAKNLEYIPEITPETADAIIAERSGRADGFTSLADLLTVPGIGRRQLAIMYEFLTVRSNVFVVTSRGRDAKTGIEVEMQATVDRSALPVVLQEVRVR